MNVKSSVLSRFRPLTMGVAAVLSLTASLSGATPSLAPSTDASSSFDSTSDGPVSGRGSFDWSYGFVLPRARGANQPHLAISYDSSLNDGHAGMGMHVGWPTIERAPLRVRRP
jgi:hypothetical protein